MVVDTLSVVLNPFYAFVNSPFIEPALNTHLRVPYPLGQGPHSDTSHILIGSEFGEGKKPSAGLS